MTSTLAADSVTVARATRPVSWTLIGLVAAACLVLLLIPKPDEALPGWGQLPAPQLLASGFDVAPAAAGTKVNPALVPVALWSGATEELTGGGRQVVAFDGPGALVYAKGVQVAAGAAAGVVKVFVGGHVGQMVAWQSGGGWVAVVVWGADATSVAVAARLAGLQHAAGMPVAGA